MEKELQKQFIDSAKFNTSFLPNLVDNLAKRIHEIKCKHGGDNKNRGIKYKHCVRFIE